MPKQPDPPQETRSAPGIEAMDVTGMWVTADGHIRQELRADGRYDEARGTRRSAYTGSYTVTGSHIDYADDTGFTATGDIRDGVLFHEHLVLYREGRPGSES
ncbi:MULTISPECIES: Atu4866 domain-containing protein [Isoptericola]|nr:MULTISPECIES: Atu4866 domain-containing protein [unclassified Isoptericola]MDO8145719.1 Atu4866 domain-containing protein [Isoptericola sp. 178]MDO8149799.1 Atu4866 domain-containing protein [Isoptericola sp. b408]